MKLFPNIIKCKGEAHSNPHIDNCGICLPHWEYYPVCPTHKTKIVLDSGYCKECNKYYNLEMFKKGEY